MLKLTFADRQMQGPWFHLTTIDSRTNSMVGMHTHDYDEIFWVLEGEAEHHINGSRQRLNPGDLVLMRSHDVHQLRPLPYVRFTNLSISPHCSAHLASAYPAENKTLLKNPHLPWCHHGRSGELDMLSHQALELASRPQSLLTISHFVTSIWLRCLHWHKQTSAAITPDSIPNWLAEACLRIEEPDIFCHGVPGFIRVAGKSAEHVSRSCRQYLNRRPSEIVNQARMQWAANASTPGQCQYR